MSRPFAALIVVAVLGVTPCAFAEPSAEDRATARELAAEGYQALKNQDYELAADRFRRADALVHAPTLVVDLARSLVGLGRLVEAHESYQIVIREGVTDNVPWSWKKAYENAIKEDQALEPRLAWITIQVYGHDDPTVKIDGREISAAAIGVKRAIDPGKRTILVEAPGLLPAEKTLELPEGGSTTLAMTLMEEDAPTPSKAVVIEQTNAASDPQPRNLVPVYVAFGVGAAGFVTAGVTGGLMLSKRSKLDDACNSDGACPRSMDGVLTKYRTYGTISAIGLGVGVAGAVTGVSLWLLGSKSTERPEAAVVQPVAAPGYVGVSGRF